MNLVRRSSDSRASMWKRALAASLIVTTLAHCGGPAPIDPEPVAQTHEEIIWFVALAVVVVFVAASPELNKGEDQALANSLAQANLDACANTSGEAARLAWQQLEAEQLACTNAGGDWQGTVLTNTSLENTTMPFDTQALGHRDWSVGACNAKMISVCKQDGQDAVIKETQGVVAQRRVVAN